MEYKGYSGAAFVFTSGVMDRFGWNVEQELSRLGVPAEQLDSSWTGFSPVLETRLLQYLAHRLGDEATAVHLGERQQTTDLRLMWFYMYSQPTVRGAFEHIFRFLQAINDVEWSFVRSGSMTRLVIRAASPVFWSPAMAEYRLSSAANIIEKLTPYRVRPVEVHHSHPAPATAAEFSRRYGAPVRFGQCLDALVYLDRDLDCPCAGANPLLARALDSAVRNLTAPPTNIGWTEQVRAVLSHSMPAGGVSLAVVAQALGVPPRTLVHKLAREGCTFHSVLDGLRRDVSMIRVATPGMTVERLAQLLGFDDLRSFYRAFKRWTGTTPRQFRGTKSSGLPA